MTLRQFILNGFPSFNQSKDYGLVFDLSIKEKIDEAQAKCLSKTHKIEPSPTAGGKWFIRAAVLSEAGGGIFTEWFNNLDQDVFDEIMVFQNQEITFPEVVE